MAAFLGFVSFLLSVVATIHGAQAKKMLRDIGNTTRSEVEAELAEKLAGHIPLERIDRWENALKSMYVALPKNEHDLLGHQGVRYALHRVFVASNSWYIRGLEPTSKSTANSKADWVPSYVQDHWEAFVGTDGVGLRDLSILASVLEDLIHQEAKKRLAIIYEVLLLPTDTGIKRESAMEAIDTYTMVHLLGGRKNISISNPEEVGKKRAIFKAKYKNYTEFSTWFQKIEDKHLPSDRDSLVSFQSVVDLIEEFTNNYGTFNDVECKNLKRTLQETQGVGRGAGRVRLSDFYNMSRHSHWKFHEKLDYLRDLGTVDEADPKVPMLIVPNYITSRPNCLEATPLYSICCRNECEELIGSLERQLAAPRASPTTIAQLVSAMSSDTVEAPRTLPDSLFRRLGDIAQLHAEEIDMHSRLFSQWMHHAFPRECPYPHEAGTTNPVSADEWMAINGHDSQMASDAEMQRVLDNACKSNGAGVDEDGELPWSHVEEMLEDEPPPPEGALYGLCLMTLCLWFSLSAYLGRFRNCLGKRQLKTVLLIAAMCVLLSTAIMLELVDKELMACVVVLGFVFDAIRFFTHAIPRKAAPLPKVL